jgi:hypothetical protein
MGRTPAEEAFNPDGPTEIGPVIGERILTREEVIRAFRGFKRKGIPLTEIARQAGYRPATLYNCLAMDRIGVKMRTRLTWIVKALQKGHLVAVRSGGRGWVFLPSGAAALKRPEIKARLERCVCGRYVTCPCGAFKPARVRRCLLPSHSVAVAKRADTLMNQVAQSPNARSAVPYGGSGSLSVSPLGSLQRKLTKT